MKVVTYATIDDFMEDTFEVLLKKEAQNNLLIGNALAAREGNIKDYFFITIKDTQDKIYLTAIMKEPFGLAVYETSNEPCEEAVLLLAKELTLCPKNLSSIIGEQGLINRLTKAYCALTAKKASLVSSMNLLKLTQVIDFPKPSGYLRLAQLKDLFFLPYWEEAFAIDCKLPKKSFDERVGQLERKIKLEKVYIWENKHPVCMVQHGKQLVNGAAVSYVYTPPHFRSKHYGKVCVAEAMRYLLSQGNKFCCLFADTLNPISNKIYEQIGYKQLCVIDEVKFQDALT